MHEYLQWRYTRTRLCTITIFHSLQKVEPKQHYTTFYNAKVLHTIAKIYSLYSGIAQILSHFNSEMLIDNIGTILFYYEIVSELVTLVAR